MLHKEDFIQTYPDVRIGMTAYSVDGEKLGAIERIDEDNITIEKGWFFRKDFVVAYDDIMDVRGDQITLRQTREELESGRMDMEEREYGFAREESGYESDVGGYERGAEETRIPLREEELEARKREREGEVRIHKDVYTETQHIDVPVQKEEVVVERVPVEERRSTEAAGAGAFREEEIRIPVKEEEVEVTKRPVVKEEVRARKETTTEHRDVSGEVRKEEVSVETDQPADKTKR